MNCWIQDGKSETHFMPTSGGVFYFLLVFEGALLYFLAPSDDSSSFCRLRWAIFPLQASSMTLQMHLYGVQLLLPVVRDWSPHKWIARGSFARPLRLASLLWFLRTRFASRLSDRGCWGKPLYQPVITQLKKHKIRTLFLKQDEKRRQDTTTSVPSDQPFLLWHASPVPWHE